MELEVTVVSAKDLHNVNWRHGDIKPYVAAWVDPNLKSSTRVGYKLTLPLRDRPEDSTLRINVVHGSGEAETKQLIGSATLPLREVIEDAGFDHRFSKTLKLRRLSGRLQGEIQDHIHNPAPKLYCGYAYGAPPAPPVYSYTPPARGYYGSYGGEAPSGGGYYGNFGGAAPPAARYYGKYPAAPPAARRRSEMGMGTGVEVGAVAEGLRVLALDEGADYVEDKIPDDVAEGVEGDFSYDDGFGDDGFFLSLHMFVLSPRISSMLILFRLFHLEALCLSQSLAMCKCSTFLFFSFFCFFGIEKVSKPLFWY
ncbi:hypothetical protein AMTRI_Chr07g30000 [Amborella trichopoda]